jgi:hypothetical protein
VKCVEWLEEDLPLTSKVLFRQAAEAMQKMDSCQGVRKFRGLPVDIQQEAGCLRMGRSRE